MLQIDNLSYRILGDKLPPQKQHAHVEMYTYPPLQVKQNAGTTQHHLYSPVFIKKLGAGW